MADDWHSAFLRQARSDFDMFRKLTEEEAPMCQRLHYLQMATEKLSKGLKVERGAPAPPTIHEAFVSFLRIAKGRSDVQRLSRIKRNEQYRAYVEGLIPTAQAIEDLTPKGGEEGLRHVNAEYPWERPDGSVVAPVEHDYSQIALEHPNMIKLLNFIEVCLLLP